jgi:hypothetical protein
VIRRLSSNKSIKAVAILLALVTALILGLSSLTGCSGTPSNTFTELLNLVPAEIDGISTTEASSFLTLIDYASLYKDFNVSFSTPEEMLSATFKDIFVQRVILGSFITGYSQYALSSTIRKQYVGYDVTNVDAEIRFGFPPANGVAAIGRFNPRATGDALNNQDEWPSWAKDSYATEEYRGITIHSWGSGVEIHLTNTLNPPHLDFLGRAMPLVVTDNYLFYQPSLETVKLMIDASQNKCTSLADLPEYAALADGLKDVKAYAALMGNGDFANNCLFYLQSGSLQLTEEQKAAINNSLGTPMKTFLTFASGVGRDDRGTYTAIIIYHENAADALENVSLLKQHIENAYSISSIMPWKDTFTATDIKAEGNVLIAKLYCDSSSFWASWVDMHDTLLYHEE